METIPRLGDSADLPPQRAPQVDAFLTTLRTEQARFLEVVRQAQSQLQRDGGQLGQVAATQLRMTQQFFDAQRSIMSRRADVDAEVALIDVAAEDGAAASIDEAREHAAAGDVIELRKRLSMSRAQRLAWPERSVQHRSARDQISVLGLSVVRTSADVDDLAHVIDDAFAADEPDSIIAQRQLTSLLDEWWSNEQQEGLAVIEDARARSAMRRHVAGIQACEIIEAACESHAVAPAVGDAGDADDEIASTILPRHICVALDAADPSCLQDTLAALANSLQLATSTTNAPETPPAVIGFDPPTIALRGHGIDLDAEAADPYRRFWSTESMPASLARVFRSTSMRAGLVVVAGASSLGLLRAVVG